MDIDDTAANSHRHPQQQHPSYALHPTNALAGPSTLPALFLPPPEPLRPAPHFRSTDDLLSRFQLLSAYDRYVRPYSTPSGVQLSSVSTDKGKGKEKEIPFKDPSTPATLPPSGSANDGDEEESAPKGEKKWKNGYKHLIKGIPGKHSMKKDDYLMTMMQVPPKQRNKIVPFDLRTQREAFSVSLEGLKGWNIHALVAESAQAREDRKRRKEMKRLAKAQQLAATPGAVPASGTPVPAATTTTATTATTNTTATTIAAAGTPSASGVHSAAVRSNTPRPGSARPPAAPPTQNTSLPRGPTPVGVGTPRSVTTPGAGGGPMSAAGANANPPPPPISAATSAPAILQQPQQTVFAPVPVAGAAPPPGGGGGGRGGGMAGMGGIEIKRGVKREREESASVGTGVRSANGNTRPGDAGAVGGATMNGVKPGMMVGAKAGMNGIRQRPVKKARMDGMPSVPGVSPVQQPTPHA